VFGLLSALSWGAGDFGGGLASRRAPVLGIVLITQTSGALFAFVIFVASGEPPPSLVDAFWSCTAAIAGAIGITALYAGLAAGRMSVVAPVTGVLAVAIPVAAGLVLEGVPREGVLAGIGLAVAAVVLVSRVEDHAGRSGGLRFALIAGTGIGIFNVLIGQVSQGLVLGPLTIMRLAQAVAIVGFILVGRSAWRVRPTLVPAVLLIGLLDMGGNAFYIAARQAGELAVAATLSSLYPVTTVILAALLLRERITLAHAAGILLAAVAVGLIASGAA
jgi:drug/metabolite transporter (DMT)-like permease